MQLLMRERIYSDSNKIISLNYEGIGKSEKKNLY